MIGFRTCFTGPGEKGQNMVPKRVYRSGAVKRPVDEPRPYGADNPANICPPSAAHAGFDLHVEQRNIWRWTRGAEPVGHSSHRAKMDDY